MNRHRGVGDTGQIKEQSVAVAVAEITRDAQDCRVDGTDVDVHGAERVGGELIGSRHQQVGFGIHVSGVHGIGVEVQPETGVVDGGCRVETGHERRSVGRVELEAVLGVAIHRVGAEQEAGRGRVGRTGSGDRRVDTIEVTRGPVARVRRVLRAVIEDARVRHIDQQALATVVVEDRGVDSKLPQ